jgi:hypothetical protein
MQMTEDNIIERLSALADEIRSSVRGADVEFTVYPSGSAMLDVRLSGRLYVLEYSPTRGFGVDEVQDGEGFTLGYRFASGDVEAAADELSNLLSAAVNS